MEKLDEYLRTHKASDLAATLGVTNGYISQLRKGRASISLKRAFEIEKATGGAVPASAWVKDGGGE